MKTLRVCLLVILAFAAIGCGGAPEPLQDAERDEVIGRIFNVKLLWEPASEYPHINNSDWFVQKHVEQDGVIAVGSGVSSYNPEDYVGFTHLNGELAMVTFYKRREANGLDVYRYFFYKDGKLVHAEESGTEMGATWPVKPDSKDMARLSKLIKEFSPELSDIIARWQTEQQYHDRRRRLETIDLRHVADLRPLTGAAQLLRDAEFVDGLKALCSDKEWLYDALWSWLAGNPPVQRIHDGSDTGIVVRTSSPRNADGNTIEEIILAVDFPSGALLIGYYLRDHYNPHRYMQTGSPISDSIVDILRPYMPIEESYEYEGEDCCGDYEGEYPEADYYEGEYPDGDYYEEDYYEEDYDGAPYGGDDYDYEGR